MTTTEARNALLMPQSIKQAVLTKTKSNTGKTNKHCTNCGMKSHNVETCRKKKEKTMVATIEAAQPNQKTQNTSSYACHICGLNGHKMTDCPKFVEMQKMFHGKFVTIVEVQLLVETQIVIVDVNVVDVNATIRSKIIEEQVFKDREPKKTKNATNWEKEERFKQSMVQTIQQIQKTQIQTKRPFTSMEGQNITWLSMPNTTFVDAQKSQEVVNSQGKLIEVEKIFLDISKQMLKTSYILNLGQLLKIAPKLKRYLWQKVKLEKTQNVSKVTINKQVDF